MKSKNKWNTVLDLILFVVMLAVFCIKGQYHEPLAYTIGLLAALHIILHWKQFTIMIKKNIGNKNVILDILMFLVMLSLFMVEGNIHEIMAWTIGVLSLVHVIWHWKQFKLMYCQLIPDTYYRYLVAALTVILLTAVLAAPNYLTIQATGKGHGGPPPGYAGSGRGHH
ncbi:MAG: hypothetical protein ABRQ26_03460 [Syntrophomonadaceae bacterium]